MDFSIVEGLTVEEVNELYDDSIMYDSEYKAWCGCYTKSNVIDFGINRWGGDELSCGNNAFNFCGYCFLQLREEKTCKQWCDSLNFDWLSFNDKCLCNKYGRVYETTWHDCTR